MFRVPRRLPRKFVGVRRHLEYEHDHFHGAAGRRDFFYVNVGRLLPGIPMTQGFPHVDAVANRGREFIDTGKIFPE